MRIPFIVLLLLILSLFTTGCVLNQDLENQLQPVLSNKKILQSPVWPEEYKTFIARGISLEPLIASGTELLLIHSENYEKDDIVMYNFSGHDTPIAKIIKAVPGDKWSIDQGNIIVNNKVLKNSAGITYNITNPKMLKLYAKSYPIIPENTYLLLGDQPAGSLDSSRFGLVSAEQIAGKLTEKK